MSLTWTLKIDWDGDGTPEDAGDGARISMLTVSRGRRYWLSQDGVGFVAPDIGRMVATVQNYDGRYDPYNTSSPLYPNVRPGILFQLQVSDGSTTYDVMAGRIWDIKPRSRGAGLVTLEGVDGWRYLADARVSTALQEGQTEAEILDLILDDVDWPTLWGRDIASGVDTIDYWWADSKSARSAIRELMGATFGTAALLGDGKFRYKSRHTVTSSIATLTESDYYRPSLYVAQPWEVVRNKITVHYYPRTLEAGVELWRAQDIPIIPAGGSLTLWASFSYDNESCPAKNVVTPVATTDYTANSKEDGTGTDMTSDISISMTAFSESAKLVISNSASQDAYMTFLRVRGDAVALLHAGKTESEDSTSEGKYGVRQFSVDEKWLQDANTAWDFANYLRGGLSNPRPFLEMALRGQPSKQFGIDLEDKVHVTLSSRGIDDDFSVAHIEHRWLDHGGQVVETTLLLESRMEMDSTYWRFPTTLGVSSRFAY